MFILYGDVLVLLHHREHKRPIKWAHTGSEPAWWVKVVSSVILTLTPQTQTRGPVCCFLLLCLKAKGYIKVQIICICMWLWESPTRLLSLCAVCLCDPPHRPTIYAVDDSSPWSHASAQWRQASRAMAALLARLQNAGKISLGLRLGASCSVTHPLQENTFRTATFRIAVSTSSGEPNTYRAKEAKQAEWRIQARMWGQNVTLLQLHVCFLQARSNRRQLR